MRKIMPAAAVVLAGGIAFGGPANLTVPDLLDKTPEAATELVKRAGFTLELEMGAVGCERDMPDSLDGKVRCQSPAPGEKAEKIAIVQYELFHAPTHLVNSRVDALVGLTLDEAKAKIRTWKWAATSKGKIHLLTVPAVAPCKIDIVCAAENLGSDELNLSLGAQAHTKIRPPAP
jgi:hypothetical protein